MLFLNNAQTKTQLHVQRGKLPTLPLPHSHKHSGSEIFYYLILCDLIPSSLSSTDGVLYS